MKSGIYTVDRRGLRVKIRGSDGDREHLAWQRFEGDLYVLIVIEFAPAVPKDGIYSSLRENSLVLVIIVLVPALGIAWKVFIVLYLTPRNEKIRSLEDKLEKAERSINDTKY